AQKSTSTGRSLCTTSCSQFADVNSITFLVAMIVPFWDRSMAATLETENPSVCSTLYGRPQEADIVSRSARGGAVSRTAPEASPARLGSPDLPAATGSGT